MKKKNLGITYLLWGFAFLIVTYPFFSAILLFFKGQSPLFNTSSWIAFGFGILYGVISIIMIIKGIVKIWRN